MNNDKTDFPKVLYEMEDRFNITILEIELPNFGDN
jgi:hypothetical protein